MVGLPHRVRYASGLAVSQVVLLLRTVKLYWVPRLCSLIQRAEKFLRLIGTTIRGNMMRGQIILSLAPTTNGFQIIFRVQFTLWLHNLPNGNMRLTWACTLYRLIRRKALMVSLILTTPWRVAGLFRCGE